MRLTCFLALAAMLAARPVGMSFEQSSAEASPVEKFAGGAVRIEDVCLENLLLCENRVHGNKAMPADRRVGGGWGGPLLHPVSSRDLAGTHRVGV